jgi:hypothetical protein
MGQLEREAIADLVLENQQLKRQVEFYQCLGQGSEMLYHCMLAGLPPRDRGYSLDEKPGAEKVVELAGTRGATRGG